jgi:hypothetical protein
MTSFNLLLTPRSLLLTSPDLLLTSLDHLLASLDLLLTLILKYLMCRYSRGCRTTGLESGQTWPLGQSSSEAGPMGKNCAISSPTVSIKGQ